MVTTLKLDIDNSTMIDAYTRINKVSEMLNLKIIHQRSFSTTHGFHFYIIIEQTLTDMETCLLQSLMGSDYKRECFNLIRIKNKVIDWNVLFHKKYRYKDGKLTKVSEEK